MLQYTHHMRSDLAEGAMEFTGIKAGYIYITCDVKRKKLRQNVCPLTC